LRGKIVIADENKTIGGSINLSPGNFDLRRELAIEIKSKRVLKRFVQVSRRDGKQSVLGPGGATAICFRSSVSAPIAAHYGVGTQRP
jgi:phosphatidylserine/phosphatidylglycerophosphate/cardiolipin synthase-like enzyme